PYLNWIPRLSVHAPILSKVGASSKPGAVQLLSAIKQSKANRQIILVSHNATIPMLGDAQNVVLCRNEDKFITIRSSPLEGSIGGRDVVDLIASTTDGGKVSIKKRVKKYNLKRFRGEDETDL
ncbi:MAG: hypothetical protein JW990_21915, partial [Thermoleophilia bacterium]|nr:hypothetical protein [Thermoleophilia bacterium]